MLQFTQAFIKYTTISSDGILAVTNLPVSMRRLHDMSTHSHPDYRDRRDEKPWNLIKNRKENGILSEIKEHDSIQCLGFS